MSVTLTSKLRLSRPGVYKHWCEGCEEAHLIEVDSPHGEVKTLGRFNGSIAKPTFFPSNLVTSIVGVNDRRVCSYFVTEGYIEYLKETTHHLSGLTVEIPDFPPYKIP